MRLLKKVEHTVVRRGRRKRGEKDAIGDIGKEEITKAIKRLNDEKTAGIDGITSEVRKYGQNRIQNSFRTFLTEYGEKRNS